MIYISGGITGVENYREHFDEAEKLFTEKGLSVCNPARRNAPYKNKPWEWYMKRCIKWLCGCDIVYMLVGWENSRGAYLEHFLARDILHLTIMYEVKHETRTHSDTDNDGDNDDNSSMDRG